MSTFARLADLPLELEALRLDRLERDVSSAFTRRTTVVRLTGAGEVGLGEDVTYAAADHDLYPELDLAGSWTLATLAERLDGLDLFSAEPEQPAYRLYRRWAFESAALDLALRQAGRSLPEALGREPRPLRFVVSMRLPEPVSAAPVRDLVERYPGTRFKLDPTPDWSEELVAELAELDVVDQVDLKGAYSGTVVDNPPDPGLYRLVAEGFPRAYVEDPALTPETDAVLAPHRERITWDAPIHSVADVDALPFPPRALNCKPSRFGSLRALCDFYDACAERGIALYGGGQFELGVGRDQIQLLASIFHADTPNDVAPGGYNDARPGTDLPRSPLSVRAAATGFQQAPAHTA